MSNPCIFRRLSICSVCVLALTAARPMEAQTITVPNYSFENPTTTFVTSFITNWTQTAQPVWYNPANFGNYPWSVLTGVFLNTAPAAADHITNLDGSQAALLFAVPDLGIYQDLTATYQVGKSYHLTIGYVGGSTAGLIDGVTIDSILYYRDPNNANAITSIGSVSATENSTGIFNDHTTVHDFTMDIPTVQAGDAWAGQPIGVEVLSTANFGNANGYWDVDNVRLTATAAPEPGSALLAVFGGLVLLARRGRLRGV
jgi:hypothetical protein